MIAMRCSCGSDFWVRDRLAGRTVNCPSCGISLAVPPLETVKVTMTSAPCNCGEVFWSSAWQPGKQSRCPICGGGVGPSRSKGGSETVTTPRSSGSSAPPLKSSGVRSNLQRDTPPISGPGVTKESTVPPPKERWGLPVGEWSPQILGLVFGALAVCALGVVIGSRLLVPTPPAIETTTEPAGQTDVPSKDHDPDPSIKAPSQITSVPALSAPLRALVPAYFYPGGEGLEDWNQLIEAGSRIPIVAVVNPATGPGPSANPDYAEVIRRAKAAGVTTLGYVNTDYAKRPRQQIEADVEKWLQFYPEIGGIFFDAQPSEAQHADLYASMRALVKAKRPDSLIITNPGIVCAEPYLEKPATDVAILFENQQGFNDFALPSWAGRYQASRIAAIPYALETPEQMKEAVRQAVLKGIGYLYVTDGTGPNPWGHLPRYWKEEVDALERINQRKPL